MSERDEATTDDGKATEPKEKAPESSDKAPESSDEAPPAAEEPVEAAEEPVDDAEPVEDEEPPELKELREHLALTSDEVERLRAQLSDAQARLRAVSKAYTDQKEEMADFRRRQEQQAQVRAERRAAELVERFFEPVQNLRRALGAPATDAEGFRRGLDMVLHQFMDTLHGLGLEEVPGEGSDFDAEVHEAIALQPVDDPAKDGQVLVVHNTGYRLKGKTLQPAMVVVGKYEEQEAPAEEPSAEEAPSEEPTEG